jgi:predicted AAA+ superfamily ATPase
MPKLYFIDTGLLCYLLKIGNAKQLYSGAFFGAIFENFCVSETIKILSIAGKEDSIYFLRTNKGIEVDMMIEKDDGFMLVEFKAGMSIGDKAASNISLVSDSFKGIKAKEALVVSMNDQKYNLRNSVAACGAAEYFQKVSKIG